MAIAKARIEGEAASKTPVKARSKKNGMVKLKALRPFMLANNKSYKSGDVLEIDERSSHYLVDTRKAERI